MKNQILEVAHRELGFDTLRPGQETAVRALLEGRNCLTIMPTGAGKSAIYQIAGSMMKGLTLIVSPLIALQKDQVEAIREQMDEAALVINSAQRASENREVFEKLQEGAGKFVFLAPEQFHKRETVEALQSAGVSLFVVDEAHCISEWGHDFRPDYLRLGPVIEALGHPVTLAMTATASPEVRDEIVRRLGLRDPEIIVQGFDRPNIHLRVDRFENEDDKLQALVHRVRWAHKPGIVYVGTRRNAEEIMRLLKDEGVDSLFYHAGLKASERTAIQEQFMAGQDDVIVATNAFGMGIDKSDVRFVYHYDVTDSIDSYYQEIGRAGRDGEKSEAILFFRPQDIGAQKFKAGETRLEPENIEHVAEIVAGHDGPVGAEEIAEQSNLSERKLTAAIHRLEDVGALEVLPSGEVCIDEAARLSEAAQAAAEEQERRREMKRQRLLQMEEYAGLNSCRREYLLRYFGDQFSGPCNNCDNCEKRNPDIAVDPSIGTRREVA
ncbi:MAG: ATP-dependent DNA helicase RecQ [Acidobacteriaceae bacterium]|nr:ATP-dependent DNA helicase RecQ [Acidobacteriaceae bacterium]